MYPLPQIKDALDTFLGAGYWQLEMHYQDIKKMAFTCLEVQNEFVRMPFELRNAPATLQQALDILIMGLNWEEVLIYLDDLIMFTPTFEIFLERFE